ncbi:MAG: DUF1674 domain-containing protein [Rickettsiales bacterium]
MEKPTEKTPPKPETQQVEPAPRPKDEVGGSGKPEPTRYNDWEIGGKCVDF